MIFSTKNVVILVVTITGTGPHPMYICIFKCIYIVYPLELGIFKPSKTEVFLFQEFFWPSRDVGDNTTSAQVRGSQR